LVERHNGIVRVRGSTPLISTKDKKMNKVEFGTYPTAYDMMDAALNHRCCDKEPSLIADDYKDTRLMRLEIGVKCQHCGESFRIAVRRLRTTMHDPRLKNLSRKYPYMDLLKIMKR
jgi:hypothetical protein